MALRIRKSMFYKTLFSVFTAATLAGCATNWVMSPRDRSIKKWEANERCKAEQSSDSIRTTAAGSDHGINPNVTNPKKVVYKKS